MRTSSKLKAAIMKANYRKTESGFTLVELLVVIAIVLVLAALVFMGVGRATKAAYKAESIGNIKQLSAITMAGAADNQGIFPEMHFGDLPFWFTRTWREESDVTREMSYSSANKCWSRDGVDICSSPKRNLWDYANKEESTMISYSCLVNDTGWADQGDFLEPDNWQIIKERVTVKVPQGEKEDNNEPQVRWFLERTNQEVAYPILWMDLSVSWNNQRIGNFMKDTKDPEGLHVGYLDGSIGWVNGKDMKRRYSGGGVSLFW